MTTICYPQKTNSLTRFFECTHCGCMYISNEYIARFTKNIHKTYMTTFYDSICPMCKNEVYDSSGHFITTSNNLNERKKK